MKLTMDGKLSRKEVRKRREKRGRKGEKSCQKGNEKRSELERVQCKWRTTEREREREKRQLLIESEFEETQKKGEKEKWEKEGKLPWKSEGGCANSIRKEGRGERWVIIEKIDPTSGCWLNAWLTLGRGGGRV